MIDATATLGSLASNEPGATRVFLRYRLDFCCGGRRSLAEACDAAGLDVENVIDEVEALGTTEGVENDETGWEDRPLSDLIDHILVRFHEPLRRDLPALVDAARRVERVHANKALCPRGLAEHLVRVHGEILQHLMKEENVLFPALIGGRRGPAVHMPIRVMMQEHDDHGENLRRIRELAHDFALPEDACGTWRALYEGLASLEAELVIHIHLENNVLFPRALNP